MNKYLHYLAACLLALAALSSCNDDNEPTSVVEPEPTPEPSGYCLMYYASGGYSDFDITLMESARQAAGATGDDVAATILFKGSGKAEGEAHNGTRRYTAQDGVMTQDAAFGTVDDFEVTSPDRLAEFIRWSAEQFPGRRYLLVFAGAGYAFDPDYDLPEADTRSALYDSGKMMTAAQLGDAIRQSGVTLEALIANTTEQACIEMLAEWEGTADYLLCEPFYLPDIAYDYAALIADLREGYGVEETLKRTARRAINLWQPYYDEDEHALLVEVTRLRDLTPLWDVLRETFAFMLASKDEVNVNYDGPSVRGQTYGQGYMRALRLAWEGDWDDFYDDMRPDYTIDIVDYLHTALTHSGNLKLAPYINRLDEVMADIIVAHHQTDGKHKYFFNVYTTLYNFSDGERAAYRRCRFEQLTGWTAFYEDLMDYCKALPDKQGSVLTPIADNILGKWKIVARAYKQYGEWVENPLNGISGTFTFRPNGKLFSTYTSASGITSLALGDWGNPDDENFTFEQDGYTYRVFNMTANLLDFGPAETTSGLGIPRYVCRRINDEPLTTAERMVGRWTLARRYEKVDGEWREITEGLPAECWTEYTEAGTFTTYTRWPGGEEWLNEDMRWNTYEDHGVVGYYLPDNWTALYFRVSLEANGSRMVMNYAEDYDPNLDEQVNTEYKDILIKANE